MANENKADLKNGGMPILLLFFTFIITRLCIYFHNPDINISYWLILHVFATHRV